MAGAAGADVVPVDMGMLDDKVIEGVVYRLNRIHMPELFQSDRLSASDGAGDYFVVKSRNGSRDFLQEPAMTPKEVMHSIEAGIRLVMNSSRKGVQIIATGEMGIGNTTTSAAIAAELLKLPTTEVTGRGAGIDEKGLLHKIEVIDKARDKYRNVRFKWEDEYDSEAFRILTLFGGYDIAGMVGVFLGGSIFRIPVVIDGLISAVAAFTAEKIFPGVKNYALPSHMGKEPAMQHIMDELDMKPVIYGNLALGEGTGAVMLFPLLDQALAVYNHGAVFSDINVEQYKDYSEPITSRN
jgi:nicotinate-nucleotide--dimethylbenzimidazole phosphoribosyltransferase